MKNDGHATVRYCYQSCHNYSSCHEVKFRGLKNLNIEYTRLRVFTVKGSFLSIRALLRRLTVPSKSIISLDCICTSKPDEDFC